MFFSVIIPVYQAEKYLSECVQSVIEQDFDDLEIILVDDGSTDRSGEICDEFAKRDGRVRAIHLKNGGVSAARNAALHIAKGDYLLFLDADDYYKEGALRAIEEFLQKTKAEVCFFEMEWIEQGRVLPRKIYPLEANCLLTDKRQQLYPVLIRGDGFKSVCFVAIQKMLAEGIFFDCQLKTGEDFDFLLQIYDRMHSFCYLPKVCYVYRMVEESCAHNWSDSKAENAISVQERVSGWMKKWGMDGPEYAAMQAKSVIRAFKNFAVRASEKPTKEQWQSRKKKMEAALLSDFYQEKRKQVRLRDLPMTQRLFVHMTGSRGSIRLLLEILRLFKQ